jgi:hypothetical protein
MGQLHRSSKGKLVDMENLRLSNEKSIAVGNMKINARGDELGQGGQIVKTRNERMNQQYPKMQSPIASDNNINNVAPDGTSFDPPEVKEEIKPVEPKLRGSLADSIAKQVTVKQELLDPDMHKIPEQKGPQRI